MKEATMEIFTQYREGLISRQERNLSLMELILIDMAKENQRKDDLLIKAALREM